MPAGFDKRADSGFKNRGEDSSCLGLPVIGASIQPCRIAAPGLHGLGEVVAYISRDAVALQTNWAGVAKLAQRLQEGQPIKRAATQGLDVVLPAGLLVKFIGATDRDRPEPRHRLSQERLVIAIFAHA